MEHPHDPYHVRPFPQQPHRGGKELKTALLDLEAAFEEKIPDFERIRSIQERIHRTANRMNDDKLVDLLRQLSEHIDAYQESPDRKVLERLMHILLKVRVELKHL